MPILSSDTPLLPGIPTLQRHLELMGSTAKGLADTLLRNYNEIDNMVDTQTVSKGFVHAIVQEGQREVIKPGTPGGMVAKVVTLPGMPPTGIAYNKMYSPTKEDSQGRFALIHSGNELITAVPPGGKYVHMCWLPWVVKETAKALGASEDNVVELKNDALLAWKDVSDGELSGFTTDRPLMIRYYWTENSDASLR